MRAILAVSIGKLLRFLVRLVRPGGGSALPGLVANKLDPKLLFNALAALDHGLVVVSGSAGKSSTTGYLVSLLEAHGLRVFTNSSTANIRQGLVAAVLKQGNWRGRIDSDIAVLEFDEGHGAVLAGELEVRLALLTNVFSDQLDRFNDPDDVIAMLKQIGSAAKVVVINVDDKNLAQLEFSAPVIGFGLSAEMAKTRRANYALNFGTHPAISAFAEAGQDCIVVHSFDETKYVTTSLPEHQALNLSAAVAALHQLIEPSGSIISAELKELKPVFARNEEVVVSGVDVTIRLVQNPISFQLNIDELVPDQVPLMLMAGRDIHDPSWLWTVDFSKIKKVDIVGGFNANELALRLAFDGVEVGVVIEDAIAAADSFLALPGTGHTLLFSADAMRRVRRHWGLAK
jgi:UDP-N-acetylmuramyl tripeptide synthase